MNKEKRLIKINNRNYNLELIRLPDENRKAVCIVGIVTYLTSMDAVRITCAAVESILKFCTKTCLEIWITDNNSPKKIREQMIKKLSGKVNFILNNTDPIPQISLKEKVKNFLFRKDQISYGSYANGIGLELIEKISSSDVPYFLSFHNDILIVQEDCIDTLIKSINEKCRAVSFVEDKIRVNAMHVSGLLFRRDDFRTLKMSFMPDYPNLRYDVGDLITVKLRDAGYSYYVCRNTYNNPELIERIKEKKIACIHSDRAFIDDKIAFMHLGRGTLKAAGTYSKSGKTYPEEWIAFANDYLKLDV